jgi:hypothetical protein
VEVTISGENELHFTIEDSKKHITSYGLLLDIIWEPYHDVENNGIKLLRLVDIDKPIIRKTLLSNQQINLQDLKDDYLCFVKNNGDSHFSEAKKNLYFKQDGTIFDISVHLFSLSEREIFLPLFSEKTYLQSHTDLIQYANSCIIQLTEDQLKLNSTLATEIQQSIEEKKMMSRNYEALQEEMRRTKRSLEDINLHLELAKIENNYLRRMLKKKNDKGD